MEYFGKCSARGESFDFAAKRFYWDITKVIHNFKINGQLIQSYSNINQIGVWNPVIDSVFGLCYTFSPKAFKNGSIPVKYHGHDGQIHPAEIEIVFNVSNHSYQKNYTNLKNFLSYFIYIFQLNEQNMIRKNS